MLEFLQWKHQHYKIDDPRSDKSKHQCIKQCQLSFHKVQYSYWSKHSQFVLFLVSTATCGQISNSSIIKSVNVTLENGFSNHKTVVLQQTRLSLTDHATHLYKCNDVADLISIIKIRPKNWFLTSGLSRSLKVIGTDMNRPAIYDFLLVCCSNFVPKTHCFQDIWLPICLDLQNRFLLVFQSSPKWPILCRVGR